MMKSWYSESGFEVAVRQPKNTPVCDMKSCGDTTHLPPFSTCNLSGDHLLVSVRIWQGNPPGFQCNLVTR